MNVENAEAGHREMGNEPESRAVMVSDMTSTGIMKKW